MEEVAKICFAVGSLVSVLISEFLRKSEQQIIVAVCCALFGVFGFGMYPLGLELAVENTYPLDEAAGVALIFLSGQIQGAILIMISGAMEQDGDIVMCVYREEYYLRRDEPDAGTEQHIDWQNKMTEAHGKASVLIEKHRHGAVKSVDMQFTEKDPV